MIKFLQTLFLLAWVNLALSGVALGGVYIQTPAGGGGITDPDDISGLQLWWDFSDSTTNFTDTAGTTAVSSDGDGIRRHNDKSASGWGWNLSIGNDDQTWETAEQNGLATMFSDGTGFFGGSGSDNNSDGITVATVAKFGDAGGTSNLITLWANGFSTQMQMRRTSGNLNVRTLGSDMSVTSTTDFDTGYHIAIVTWDAVGDELYLYVDGTTSEDSDTTGTGAAQAAIKNSSWVSSRNHWVGEFIIYDSVLGTSDLEDLHEYLSDKWNI